MFLGRLKNFIADILDWFSDRNINIRVIGQILVSVAMIVLFLGIPLGWYEEKDSTTSNSMVGSMDVSVNNEDFDVIYIKETSKSEKYSVPQVALVFKEPTIDSEYAKNIMKYVLNQLINKASNEGRELIAFEILSYNKLFYYEMGYEYDGYFNSYIGDSLYTSSQTTDVESKHDIYKNARINHVAFKELEDTIVYDRDRIEITRIDNPSYWSEEELIRFLKIEEFHNMIQSNISKSVEFYVIYELGLEKESLKYKNYYSMILEEYQKYKKLNNKRLTYDREKLILHYRENYSDIWSNIVIFRGY